MVVSHDKNLDPRQLKVRPGMKWKDLLVINTLWTWLAIWFLNKKIFKATPSRLLHTNHMPCDFISAQYINKRVKNLQHLELTLENCSLILSSFWENLRQKKNPYRQQRPFRKHWPRHQRKMYLSKLMKRKIKEIFKNAWHS